MREGGEGPDRRLSGISRLPPRESVPCTSCNFAASSADGHRDCTVMSIKCVMAGIRVSHRFRICAEKSACKVDAVTFFHMQLVLDQVRRSTDQTLAAGRQCCNTMRIPWRVPQNWPPSRRSCVKSGWTGRCRCPRARTALRPASGTSCAARACVSSASARCCFKRGSRSTARC